VWYGTVVSSTSVHQPKQPKKVVELYSKLSGAYLGDLVLGKLTDVVSILSNLQDQAATLMKHAWCCSKDVVLFVENLRITPLGFGHTPILNMTNKQVRKVLRALGKHHVRLYMIWDETDNACFINKKRNNDFDVFGYWTRQAKRAMLEQNFFDLEQLRARGQDTRIGESNTCIAATSDMPEGRHHVTSQTFGRACALWGVQADFPDGTPCKFELLNALTGVRVEVVLGYFRNNLAILGCALLTRQVQFSSVTYTASKPTRLLWLAPSTILSNLSMWLHRHSTPLFTTTLVGIDSLVYDQGFVNKFKPH
jgi:hypothetical protein